jgi:hypothetical protein
VRDPAKKKKKEMIVKITKNYSFQKKKKKKKKKTISPKIQKFKTREQENPRGGPRKSVESKT